MLFSYFNQSSLVTHLAWTHTCHRVPSFTPFPFKKKK